MTLALSDLHKLSHAEKGVSSTSEGEEDSPREARVPGLSRPGDGLATPRQMQSSLLLAAPPASQRESAAGTVLGLLLYASCTLFSAGMSVLAKLAAARGVPVFEIVFVRSVMVASFSFIGAARSGGGSGVMGDGGNSTCSVLLGHRRALLLLRGLLGFGAGSCLYWTVVLLPISDALVLTSFAPLLVAILSPILIREIPSRTVLAGAPFCIAGVVMVARPSFLFGDGSKSSSTVGLLVAMAQTTFSALVKIIVRELRTTEQTNTIVFYLGTVSTAGGMAACLITGYAVPVDVPAFLAVFGTGLLGYGSQVTMTMALRRVKAAPATAMSYLAIVWGILAGVAIFNERLEVWSLAGAVIICGSTLAVALLEQRRAKMAEAARLFGDGSGTSSEAAAADRGGITLAPMPRHPHAALS